MEIGGDLLKIKNTLEKSVGKKVRLTSKKGRKKSIIRQGVIENTFPCIFTVKLDGSKGCEAGISRRVSYSYTDILTKAIEIAHC
ncbi:MAG: Veg family protein [Firmicutes bacterium]|nr:Veg family protein [Bacillota bacterium]